MFMFGYGEDCLTLWALKNRISEIQNKFQDATDPVVILYRPSFGRKGGDNSAIFGEFDSIFASSENIYLIESKWDNNSKSKSVLNINPEQEMRHRIFSWYLLNWNTEYTNKWEMFVKEHKDNFHAQFPTKKIAPAGRKLAINIEFVLTELHQHYKKTTNKENIKNILLYFYNEHKSTPPPFVQRRDFTFIEIDYGKEIVGNYIKLD